VDKLLHIHEEAMSRNEFVERSEVPNLRFRIALSARSCVTSKPANGGGWAGYLSKTIVARHGDSVKDSDLLKYWTNPRARGPVSTGFDSRYIGGNCGQGGLTIRGTQ